MKSLTPETPIELISIPNKNTITNVKTPGEEITIRQIFLDNWMEYLQRHKLEIRDVEIREVHKMLNCQDPNNGYLTFECASCGEVVIRHFNCNSRICTRCGKIYNDKWASDLADRLFGVPHRHGMLTMPDSIRHFFKEDRKLLKMLMDSAIKVIAKALSKWARRKVKPAFVAVLHTYGNALNWNVHLHLLVAEGGFYGNKWMPLKVIPYNVLRHEWKEVVLTLLEKHIPDTEENRNLIEHCRTKYVNGFVVIAKRRVTGGKKEIAKYIGRYVRHPAVADCRITEYNGKSVTFYYDKKDAYGNIIKREYVTMEVEEFIGALISHIPDNQFRMVRYYGGYWRIKKSKFKRIINLETICQRNLRDFVKDSDKWAPNCPKCGCKMTLIDYKPKKPHPDHLFERTLLDWNGDLRSVNFVNIYPRGSPVRGENINKGVVESRDATKINHLISNRSKIYIVEEVIRELEEQSDDKLAHIECIAQNVGKQGVDEGTLNKVLNDMKIKGMIYEPRPNQYKTVK